MFVFVLLWRARGMLLLLFLILLRSHLSNESNHVFLRGLGLLILFVLLALRFF